LNEGIVSETEIGSIWLAERSNQLCTPHRALILWYVHQGSGGYNNPQWSCNLLLVRKLSV